MSRPFLLALVVVVLQSCDAFSSRQRGATSTSPMDTIERYGFIIYPVVGLGVLALLAVGILQAFMRESIDAETRTRVKGEVVLQLRVNLQGLTLEQLSKLVGLKPSLLADVLKEMRADGVIEPMEDLPDRWRMKGASR